MILYYAMGSGLGHLTRARAVLYTLGVADRAAVLTASPAAGDARVMGGARTLRLPPGADRSAESLRAAVASALDRVRPDEVMLDVFPAGIRGELCGFAGLAGVRVTCVARLLKWEAYAPLLIGDAPRIDRTLTVEPLSGAHGEWMRARGGRIEALELRDPPSAVEGDACFDANAAIDVDVDEDERADEGADGSAAGRGMGGGRGDFWLVVHSGPPEEVDALLRYALRSRETEGSVARILLAAPHAAGEVPEGVERVDVHPAAALFPRAGRVFTAAGFNAMRQMAPWRERHRFLPFARRFDDQHLRAERAAREAAGGV